MQKWIGEIIEQIPVIDVTYTSKDADQLFRENPTCEGIIVTREEMPQALITRTYFYQKLGTLYGYHLFMKKSVELLMSSEILTVDYMTPITEVSKQAMNRKEEHLYDYVVVTENNRYTGVVSIRNLLITFAEIQAETASYSNPLTGLPGNHIIDLKLNETIEKPAFSVLYADLDNFKSYNDIYGFSMGDQVIQATASLLQSAVDVKQSFLGHIGGDDFIIILYNYNYAAVCGQIITEFDELIKHYYTSEHLKNNWVLAENRNGIKEKIPLVSISISVVTNQYDSFTEKNQVVKRAADIKKACKLNHYSCFLTNCLEIID